MSVVQEVVVKFTTRYNEEAHRLLVGHQLAPTLHFRGRVIGDLYGRYGPCGWEVSLATPNGRNTSASSCLEEGRGLLHGHDIVVGDLRNANILYVASKGDGEGCVVLVLIGLRRTEKADILPHSTTIMLGVKMFRDYHDLWQLARLETLCGSPA